MNTLLILLFIMTMLNAAISVAIWGAYRHLAGVPLIAGGFIVGALAAIAGIFYNPGPGFLTGMTGYVPALLISASVPLCVNGVMVFLGAPPRRWLVPFSIIFTAIYWPATLLINPADGALRSICAGTLGLICFGSALPVLWRLRGDCGWLRYTLLPAVLIHLGIQSGWSLYRLALRLDGVIDPRMFFPWTVIESAIAHHLWFICFLAMLGARLQHSLRQRNAELAHEVEHRRHLEQQLAATLAAERQLHAEHRQLLHIVAHEIRTPLAGIDRATEMLQLTCQELPPTGQRRLADIRDGVRRVGGLVERVMDEERAGHVRPRPEMLDVSVLLGTVLEGLAHMGAATRVQLTAASASLPLMADPALLSAVLRNLLENALKYSPSDSPVLVTLARDGNGLLLTITDRGIGIPPLERASIGQRFYRASNTNRQAGTGLGLFIVRRFLTEMGGEMRHDPGPDNCGTLVTLRLPPHPPVRTAPQPERELAHA
ncbi:HAMP domain-containing sensor histidine kinase [Niveispirillum sp. BGYR6]|uniref:sensor histidine kinase n=1 Tax=Niveispirillum sp. BGYR6 TaxID=2971249 RepID=UPI0022B9A4F1|nr:HAMP domain-containing sensor histidine kinase [Niveispirillum sp. BGYR6]MDG5496562.1 HAMP domain-containing sensor histidine kinase [Niveispirillum sp. BGYR6]